MSRWSKNRFGQTIAVSLEKENNNRSGGGGSRTVGTIGKWGNLEFTSIRSSLISEFFHLYWYLKDCKSNILFSF